MRESYDGYDIQPAAQALYEFFWSELCDWYIEVSKARLQDPTTRAVPQWVLLRSIAAFLAMMHPIMPHITEEIYSHLPIQGKATFLMASAWPEVPASFRDEESERRVERWFEITRALRALRAEAGLAAMRSVPVAYAVGDLDEGEWVIASQAWVESLELDRPDGQLISTMVQGVELSLPIEGLIDVDKERERATKERDKLLAELSKLESQLSNQLFIERAKPEVVEKLRENAADLDARIAKANARLEILG